MTSNILSRKDVISLVLKRIDLSQVSTDPALSYSEAVNAPMLAAYYRGQTKFNRMSTNLLGLTGLTDPALVKSVREAATTLDDSDTRKWTQFDVQILMKPVGTVPAPSHVIVHPLKAEKTLLFQAASATEAGVRRLTYPRGSSIPSISLNDYIRKHGLKVPPGMCLEVPVKLVEFGEGLGLAAYLNFATLRSVTEESQKEAPAQD